MPLPQAYTSKSKIGHHTTTYKCPLHFRTGCPVAFRVKKTPDRTELYSSGEHTIRSHANDRSRGLTDLQRLGVQRAVKACPMQSGSAVIDGSKRFSPGKQIRPDPKSQRAVDRMVRRTRVEVFGDCVVGIDLDGTEGSMTQLAEQLLLKGLIARHNDPADAFHLDEHQPVCCGYQFTDGVRFMTISTVHLLLNMARVKNYKWQIQGQFDGSFNFCKKDFCIIGFGVNSLGAHFNPISLSLANSESKEAIKFSFEATKTAMFSVFRDILRCDLESCGLCHMIKEQDINPFHDFSLSEAGIQNLFPLVPSSDNSKAFFSFCKEQFGDRVKVQQCGVHLSGIHFCFPKFNNHLFSEIQFLGQQSAGRRNRSARNSKRKRTTLILANWLVVV